MRAQCCICADLFENSSDINIAAAPCGHTFHEQCLMQWIEKSSTCPSCRIQIKQNKVIKRLYFDIREDCEGEQDPSELLNQNGTLKAEISTLKKDKKGLSEERDRLAVSLAMCESEKDLVTTRTKDMLSKNELLSRELIAKEKLVVSYKRELRDHMEAQRKLLELQHLNALLKDTEQECGDFTSCYVGGGDASIQQLSQMIAIVKREYSKTLADKKTLREQVETLKGKRVTCKEELLKTRKILKALQKRAEKSDQEIFSLERENNLKRRKIAHLRSALKNDKTEGSKSFIAAISEDSPNVAYSPTTTSTSLPMADNGTKVLSQAPNSPDLFDDSMREEESDNKTVECDPCGSFVTPSLKLGSFNSAVSKFKASKLAKIEQEKDAPPCPFSGYSIMQKKLTGRSAAGHHSSTHKRAFDGFGGSTKVDSDEPLGPSKNALLKFAPKKMARKPNPLLPKGQVEKPLPVDRIFSKVANPTTSSSNSAKLSSAVSNSSGSSSSFSLKAQANKNKYSSQSEIIKLFAKAHRPVLAKSSSRKAGDIIDLT